MKRRQLRFRVDDWGKLEVVDPGFDCVDILQAVDPGFGIAQSELPVAAPPTFLALRSLRLGVTGEELAAYSTEALLLLHQQVFQDRPASESGASILDLKAEIAYRYLKRCNLCAHRCGTDRTQSSLGICGLGVAASVAEHFVHIAEESPINPSLVLNLGGCGLRCRYCQQWALLDVEQVEDSLSDGLWNALDARGARTISFAGGNPDESLYGILRFLARAPEDWSLPVVWNNHSYCTPEALALLRGVVDIYLPDFKYGNNACGYRWSGVQGYFDVARQTIDRLATESTPIIVRVLVLPGHIECCHLPVLEWLGRKHADHVTVSIRGQYCPDWKTVTGRSRMAARPSADEIRAVEERARALGLRLIEGGRARAVETNLAMDRQGEGPFAILPDADALR